MTSGMDWFEAYDAALAPVLSANGFLAVVAGAEESGLLARLVDPHDVPTLARATGLPEPTVTALCRSLLLHDVVQDGDGTFTLTAVWRELLASTAFATLGDTILSAQVEARALRAVGAGEDYWTMPLEDRLVLARAVSPNPYNDGLVEGFRSMSLADPDQEVLRAGGTALELGCGVAGRILTMLRAVPGMTAVGVELDPALAAEARRRAEELGVADRFEVVVGDAADFDRPASFDRAQWSQFFFPAPARAGALAALHRALRPGGVAVAPVFGDADAIAAEPRGVEARYAATFGILLASWGVPVRTGEELVAEFEAAGFTDVGVVPAPGIQRVRAVRP
ncbi:class I SAM-dependent methyltransferase [Nocardioides ginsengisegetis]